MERGRNEEIRCIERQNKKNTWVKNKLSLKLEIGRTREGERTCVEEERESSEKRVREGERAESRGKSQQQQQQFG